MEWEEAEGGETPAGTEAEEGGGARSAMVLEVGGVGGWLGVRSELSCKKRRIEHGRRGEGEKGGEEEGVELSF